MAHLLDFRASRNLRILPMPIVDAADLSAFVRAHPRLFVLSGAGVSTATTNQATSRNNTDFGWRIDDVGFVAK